MATGTATLDFGAFPGVAQAKKTVTGQTGIVAGSLVEAFVVSKVSADHSEEEHSIEDFDCNVENIVAGASFDIVIHPRVGVSYGQYNIGWAWS